jgi:uncharacterized protein (TIGR04255 family)
MGGIHPWHKNGHAIVAATFGIEFTAPPPAAVIRDLLALHPKLKDAYPRKREVAGAVGISIGASAIDTLRETGGASSGLSFDSLRPDGTVERSIRIQGTRLVITRGDYTRWAEIWEQTRSVIEKILPIAMEHVGVAALLLSYQDRFLWDGDRTNFPADIVFRKGSQHLAPHVFQSPDLWHSYHGFFEYREEPQPHQMLHVIEAQTMSTQEDGVVARVSLNHRALPGGRPGAEVEGIPIQDVKELLGDDTGLLDDYINLMHDADKELLAEVVNDGICDLIGLKRPE